MKRLIKFRSALLRPCNLLICKCANLLIFVLANVLIFAACSKKDEPDTTAPKLPDTATLTIKDVKAYEATLSWAAASDDRTAADKLLYLVQWQASGTTEITNSGTPQPNLTEYTLTGLTESTAYKVWVTVTDEAGNTADYATKEVTTPLSKDTEAPKAGKLSVTLTAPTTASAKWTAATDNRTAPDKLLYLVQWQASGTTEISNSGTPQPKLTEYTLTGLTEKTAYKVWVTVTDEAGNHTDYEAKDFTTAEAKDTEAPKAGTLEITNLTYNSATAKWTAATDNRTPAEKLKYQVLWNVKGSTEVKSSGTPQANLYSFSLKDLAEKTTYEVKVVVLDETGNQALTGKEFTTPAKPEPEYYTPERFDSWAEKPKIAKGETHYIVIQVKENTKVSYEGKVTKKVWADLNNNGKFDKGEDSLDNNIHFGNTRVVTLYGDFTTFKIKNPSQAIERIDVANAPNLEYLYAFYCTALTTLDVSSLKNLKNLDIPNCTKLNNLIVDKANNRKLKEILLIDTPYTQAAKLKTLLQALPDTKGKIAWHREKAKDEALKEAAKLQNSTSWDLSYFSGSGLTPYPRYIADLATPVVSLTLDLTQKNKQGYYFLAIWQMSGKPEEIWIDVNNNMELDEGERLDEYNYMGTGRKNILASTAPVVNIYGTVRGITLNVDSSNVTEVMIRNQSFMETLDILEAKKVSKIDISKSGLKKVFVANSYALENVDISLCHDLENLYVVNCRNKPNIKIDKYSYYMKGLYCYGNSYSARDIDALTVELPGHRISEGMSRMVIYNSAFDDKNPSYQNSTTLSNGAKALAKEKNWNIISIKNGREEILNP